MSLESHRSEKQKKKNYTWIVRLAGIALFAYILIFRINLSGLSTVLSKLKILPLLFSIILAFPFIFVKASRWSLILKDFNVTLSGKKSFSLYAIGLFAGHATPGQLGEFSKAIFMKKLGYTYDSSIISISGDTLSSNSASVLATAAAEGCTIIKVTATMADGQIFVRKIKINVFDTKC